MPQSRPPNERIASLDQFRGYTVVGMFLVNFVGSFQACHYLLKHNNTFCSYADTIMPQFLFAVGFALRLTFTRRVEQLGMAAAYGRIVRRLLGLILVALVVYTVDSPSSSWSQLCEEGIWGAIRTPLKRDWFQALTHIAVTSLWILPVIRTSVLARIAFMISSAALHLVLSQQFYFLWVNNGQPNAIDGGPLGFLTWTIPAIAGTLAYDLYHDEGVKKLGQAPRSDQKTPANTAVGSEPVPFFHSLDERGRAISLMIAWSIVLMAAGWMLSCGTRLYDVPDSQIDQPTTGRFAEMPVAPSREAWSKAYESVKNGTWTTDLLAEPPFFPPPHPVDRIDESYRFRRWNYWMMSQRAGTISYLAFAAGLSLFVYALFCVCCDRGTWQIGVFRTFGSNALAGYVIHMMVASAVKPFIPKDAPAWYMWSGCAIFFAITYLFVRTLEKNRIYIKL